MCDACGLLSPPGFAAAATPGIRLSTLVKAAHALMARTLGVSVRGEFGSPPPEYPGSENLPWPDDRGECPPYPLSYPLSHPLSEVLLGECAGGDGWLTLLPGARVPRLRGPGPRSAHGSVKTLSGPGGPQSALRVTNSNRTKCVICYLCSEIRQGHLWQANICE